jgi:hypothetical protein
MLRFFVPALALALLGCGPNTSGHRTYIFSVDQPGSVTSMTTPSPPPLNSGGGGVDNFGGGGVDNFSGGGGRVWGDTLVR